MLRRVAVAVLTVAVVVVVNDPVLAYPTEVDSGELHDKRTATIERYRREAREARVEAVLAAEEELAAEETTPPPEPPAAVPSSGIADMIASIFGANASAALHVASCESGLDPTATNPSGAAGLFQLMPGHWQGSFDPYDPVANARYAYGLSSGGTDWGAWASACRP